MTRKIYDFKVLLERDIDGGYVVSCPSFQGCYSQGDSVEEALENIKEAIEVCMEEMQERGEPVPEPVQTVVGSVIIVHDT